MDDKLKLTLGEILPAMQKRIMHHTTWFGVQAYKCPLDAWVYQEMIFETKPDVIVEIGNKFGGSALYLANLFDILGHGLVIGVDLSHERVPDMVKAHNRILFIDGDACERIGQVEGFIGENDRVMVIEDSAHTYENTLNVLRTYSPLVKPGDYFIVEDTIINHGLERHSQWPQGPYEAVETFLQENKEFEADRSREGFVVTWNPKGFLRRLG